MIPLYDDNRTRRFPAVTVVLITANAAVFVAQLLLPRWGLTTESWFLLFGAFIAALSANPFNPFQGTGLVLILVASLLTLVSFIVIYIVFGIIPSNPGNNRYGPNRYAGA